jgi:hypothetical protein
LHLDNQIFFFFDTKFNIINPSTFVLSFTELSVFDYYVFTLGRSPRLVVELAFLSRLALHQLSNMFFARFALNIDIEVRLLVNEASAALFTFDTLLVRYSFLSAVFEPSRGQSEVTLFGGDSSIKSLGQSGLTGLVHRDGGRLPRVAAQSLVDGALSILFSYFGTDSLCLKVLCKLSNTVVDLILSLLKLLLGHLVVLLSFSEVEFQLARLTGPLHLHVTFPVFDTLSEPLLHETSISLKFVYLNAAHLLLFARVVITVMLIGTLSNVSLSNSLIIELLKVVFEVDVLLSTVQFTKSLLEEVVANFIVLRLRDSNSLSGLVIAESSGLGDD